MAEREQRGHNPPGVTTGSPERPAEQMAASAMDFDLAAELEGLHRERSWTAGERNGKTLVREPDFRVVLTAMHAGTRLAEHEAGARLSIQTVAGHLRLHLPGRVVDLPANHLLALDRSVPHEVEALEDSALLLTLAWPGAGGRA
jgi:quercetin dioxygenase-like cupin family protein